MVHRQAETHFSTSIEKPETDLTFEMPQSYAPWFQRDASRTHVAPAPSGALGKVHHSNSTISMLMAFQQMVEPSTPCSKCEEYLLRNGVCIYRRSLYDYKGVTLGSISFAEMATSQYVVSGFWNFDTLFVPQQHPARYLQGTFYISGLLSETHDRETY